MLGTRLAASSRSATGYNDSPFAFTRSRTRDRSPGKTSTGKGKERASGSAVVVRVREAHDRARPLATGESAAIDRAPLVPALSTTEPEYDDEGCFCCCGPIDGDIDIGDGRGRLGEGDAESTTRGGRLSRRTPLDDHDDASSIASSDSTPSSLPALSPSRTPLFDDSGDEDDLLDDASESSGSFPATPRTPLSPLHSRKTFIPTPTMTDPLLSPPEGDAIDPRWAHALTLADAAQSRERAVVDRRVVDTTRITADDKAADPPVALPLRSSFFTFTAPVFSTTPASQPMAPPPATSLLTKSLRSLINLPNLNLSLPSLPPLPPLLSFPQIRPIPIGFDVEELGGMDDSLWGWRAGRPPTVEPDSPPRRGKLPRRSSVEYAGDFLGNAPIWNSSPNERGGDADDDTAAVLQLETFSPPAPPSPSRKRTIALPIIIDSPPPPSPPPATPPPAMPRLISNQRHLLMLSLELSMIHSGKINCPLRQRSVILRRAGPPMMDAKRGGGSSLKWEVKQQRRSAKV